MGQKDWYSGYAVFDVHWKERVTASQLLEMKDEINKKLTVAEVVDIRYNNRV